MCLSVCVIRVSDLWPKIYTYHNFVCLFICFLTFQINSYCIPSMSQAVFLDEAENHEGEKVPASLLLRL